MVASSGEARLTGAFEANRDQAERDPETLQAVNLQLQQSVRPPWGHKPRCVMRVSRFVATWPGFYRAEDDLTTVIWALKTPNSIYKDIRLWLFRTRAGRGMYTRI